MEQFLNISANSQIFVLTGAGISKESGIKTFRDQDGLWNNYKVEDVATPEAFYRNPTLVYEFYNKRRKELNSGIKPNNAHFSLKYLEKYINISIITQNIDNLHEVAEQSDLFVSIGTSGEVYPAAGFVSMFKDMNKPTFELNLEPSRNLDQFNFAIHKPATVAVEEFKNLVLKNIK